MSNPRQGSRSSGSPRSKSGSKHEKKPPLPRLDPEDYLKLKNAPLEVWIAEFLKRNKHFIEICRQYEADRTHKQTSSWHQHMMLMKKFGVEVMFWEPGTQAAGRSLKVKLPPPVRGIRILGKDDFSTARELRDAGRIAWKNMDLERVHLYKTCDESLQTDVGYTFVVFPLEAEGYCYKPKPIAEVLLGGKERRDVLLLAIDLRRDMKEVRRWIDRFLGVHEIPIDKRIRNDKWPIYLMVYDLRQMNPGSKKMTFEEIRETVVNAVKQDTGLQTENDASRYYKRCVELIEGGYKRYL